MPLPAVRKISTCAEHSSQAKFLETEFEKLSLGTIWRTGSKNCLTKLWKYRLDLNAQNVTESSLLKDEGHSETCK